MRKIFAVLLALSTFLYMLPTAVAIGKSRKNTYSIFVFNLFLGWTLVGWVIALSWSLVD
ncbi:MAG: superinfection immunity protein [Nitrosomonas sp.]|uniref:superinfection immunity protein n=1 Tax=Nitrosomonas sp. TaxID=42353 RepID=UPI0032ED9EA6